MDPSIHKFFYECSWSHANVRITNVGSFRLELPNEAYGVLRISDDQNSYYLTIETSPDDVPEAIYNYFKRRDEMDEAANALLRGAEIALRETTVEKALQRLPEIKRFIPNETK